MNTLLKKIRRHPALTQDHAESLDRIAERKIEDGVKENSDELIDSLPSETESTSEASDNNSMARGGPRSHHKKKTRKTTYREGRKSKNAQSSSSSLNFWNNETVYTTTEDNSGSESFDCDY